MDFKCYTILEITCIIDTFYNHCKMFDFGTDGVKYFMELKKLRQITTFVRQNLIFRDNSRHLCDKI
jgi:hypothetical protein